MIGELLIEKEQSLTLALPEMSILVGGLHTNYRGTKYGVFTERNESHTNDFFVNLLDNDTVWKESSNGERGTIQDLIGIEN